MGLLLLSCLREAATAFSWISHPMPKLNEQRSASASTYRFTRLSTSLFLQDLGFSKTDAKPGTVVENVSLERLDGSSSTLEAVMDGRPTLIVFGSVSCPMTFGSTTVLHRLQNEFGRQIKFLMLNVREAHPGENFEQPQSQEVKRQHAQLLAAQTHGPWETVVDSIDGELHRALAEKPNAAFLLAPDRTILFRSLWGADESALRKALTVLVSGSPLKKTQSSAALGPLAIGFGFFAPVLARSGSRAQRELLMAAPPIALIAALASLLQPLPPRHRGTAALALLLIAAVLLAAALA